MRALGLLLIACVALAIIRALVMALLLASIIALIWALCRYPREVAAFLTYCAFITAFRAHPLACLTVFGVAIICAQMTDTRDGPG